MQLQTHNQQLEQTQRALKARIVEIEEKHNYLQREKEKL